MKQHKIWISTVLLVCLLAMLAACGQTGSVVGSWESKSTALGLEGDEVTPDNRVILHFAEDLTGKEEQIVNGETRERVFTYRIEGQILHIDFESGTKWSFPYRLADNQLILTQNHQEIIYQKVK